MSQRAWVLFVAISLLWGLPYLLIKVAIAEIEPAIIVFARVVVSAAVLLPLALAQGVLRQVGRRWRTVLALSVVEIALPFLLIAYGEQHITSSLAGLLIAADPLFIVLLALQFDHSERASGMRLVGLCLGFLGYFSLIAAAGATRGSLITYVNPAGAVALGGAILNEPLTLATLVGFGL